VLGYAVTSGLGLARTGGTSRSPARKAQLGNRAILAEPETIERLNKIGGEARRRVRGFPVSRRLRHRKWDEGVADAGIARI